MKKNVSSISERKVELLLDALKQGETLSDEMIARITGVSRPSVLEKYKAIVSERLQPETQEKSAPCEKGRGCCGGKKRCQKELILLHSDGTESGLEIVRETSSCLMVKRKTGEL